MFTILAAAHLLIGQWSAAGVSLVATAEGARLEASCSSGATDGPVRLAADGGFAATGRFTRDEAGPARGDSAPPRAAFTGRLEGDVLRIRVRGPGEPIDYTLKAGHRGKLSSSSSTSCRTAIARCCL